MTLIEAIKQNNQEEFFKLLNLKIDSSGNKIIDEIDSEYGGNPLHVAIAYGYFHFIAPLIKAGADANKADKHGWTPTYIAAYYGRAEIITTLKAGGADVNMPNDSGTTPVCAAAYAGGAKAITALKAAGANVNTPEINGLTPIYIAVQMRDVKAIGALLETGANVNTKTPHGTPLELAKQGATQSEQDIVRLLEAHLRQYPNGIKTLVVNSESAQLNQESSQEDFAAQAPHDNPNVETKAGRDVVTITGGVRGVGVVIGGGNSSFTEASQSNSDSNPKESARVDNIAILRKLRSFFMRSEYRGSESPDCELYNRVLATYKGEVVELAYDVEGKLHRLWVNGEPLESRDAIKTLARIIQSLEALNAQSVNAALNTPTISSGSTRVQRHAGRDVITIIGGVTSGSSLSIGGGNTHYSFTAYNQFKNQNASQYNITGLVNNSGNIQLGNGNTQNNKFITSP